MGKRSGGGIWSTLESHKEIAIHTPLQAAKLHANKGTVASLKLPTNTRLSIKHQKMSNPHKSAQQ